MKYVNLLMEHAERSDSDKEHTSKKGDRAVRDFFGTVVSHTLHRDQVMGRDTVAQALSP